MRKKRKKNISAFQPLMCQSCLLTEIDVPSSQKPGSAPDVPTRFTANTDMHGCYEFAENLFGKEKCQLEYGFNTIILRAFSKQLGENSYANWKTVQVEDRLYVYAEPETSKTSFVSLLDYAEEVLDVTQVIVCIDRKSSCFGELVKCFRFMGFEHVAPNHPAVPLIKLNDNCDSSFPKAFHFLGYEID